MSTWDMYVQKRYVCPQDMYVHKRYVYPQEICIFTTDMYVHNRYVYPQESNYCLTIGILYYSCCIHCQVMLKRCYFLIVWSWPNRLLSCLTSKKQKTKVVKFWNKPCIKHPIYSYFLHPTTAVPIIPSQQKTSVLIWMEERSLVYMGD